MIASRDSPWGTSVPKGEKSPQPLLVFVEGIHDQEFLVRLAVCLRASDPQVLDLDQTTELGRLIWIPTGGSDPLAWSQRLAGLSLPQFHLYDREIPPESLRRQAVIQSLAARPQCRAFLTGQRSLENYLHPQAILAAGGPALEFTVDDSVPEILAHRLWLLSSPSLSWEAQPRRARKRASARAKKWLNTVAVNQMTAELLADRDPNGDVRMWLTALAAALAR